MQMLIQIYRENMGYQTGSKVIHFSSTLQNTALFTYARITLTATSKFNYL